MLRITIFSFFMVLLLSCRHEPVYKDFAVVSYSHDIEPIIISNCTQSGCHGTVNPASFSLASYDDLVHHTRVQAGKPESGKLYEVITSFNSSQVMPRRPYDVLTETQIDQVYVWIGQGANNN